MSTKARPDPEIERDPVTLQDLEDAVSQVLLAPAAGLPKSENREPTRDELNQRWKLTRRTK